MIQLSEVTQIDRVADLGAGDGRISIAFAKEGAWVDAYEIDDTQLEKLRRNVKDAHLTKNINIIKKDFWEADFSSYDIICIYPMPDILEKLEKKLKKELRKGALVLLNYYPLPHWKFKTTKDKVYLYVAA